MSTAVALWDRFVVGAVVDAADLAAATAALPLDGAALAGRGPELDRLGFAGFRLGTQSLLLGAEDLGRLALACERGLDLIRTGAVVAEYVLPTLISSAHTLHQAFIALANPDSSGARTESTPIAAARFELETMFPPADGRKSAVAAPSATPDVVVSALVRRPATATATAARTAPASGLAAAAPVTTAATWTPTVDDDMLDLFFDEAHERLEGLATKLIDLEQRPGDGELLRDVFRDLHTIKGSSAMVGLAPMNQLAHAAEDLVGQLREQTRAADRAVVDALLGALDSLREILGRARRRESLALDLGSVLRRLRDPGAPADAIAAASSPAPTTPPPAGAIALPAAPGAGDAEPTAASSASAAARQTIRVDFDKLDRLMNLVGELVLGRDGLRHAVQSLASLSTELSSDRHLTRRLSNARAAAGAASSSGALVVPPVLTAERSRMRSALAGLGDELGRVERVLVDIGTDLDTSTGRLDAVSNELRDSVMKLRMVPIGGVFRKHNRTVRDLALSLGKRVHLELGGEDTELDKLLVEALDEPLMHLVRNAVDHGIEPAEARLAAGKPAEGTIRLTATHRGNQVVIEIGDDGKGLDPAVLRARARQRGLLGADELDALDDRQVLDVIFRPGFSTAAAVTEVSGRGVGMDVVRQTIVTRLKGSIEIDSTPGEGSTFTLRLPLTLAIIQVLLARTGGEVLAIPLDAVVRTITCRPDEVQRIQDREVIEVRGRQVPLLRLREVLELDGDGAAGSDESLHVVLTEIGGELYGLGCEHLLGKREIVIKSLGDLLHEVPCAAGATILGDRCALILDVPAVLARALRRPATAIAGLAARRESHAAAATAAAAAPHVLIVEDSDLIRESLRRLVADAGYRVTVAVDGVDGLAQARAQRFDLVSTDVMMPRMDGYELTRALRQLAEYRDTPIVMVTSRGERIDRVRGFDAGVDEYITKPHDRQLFLRAVKKLLGREDGDA